VGWGGAGGGGGGGPVLGGVKMKRRWFPWVLGAEGERGGCKCGCLNFVGSGGVAWDAAGGGGVCFWWLRCGVKA